MSFRDVLKNIVKFARREYAEKKPLTLRVLRVKSKSILKRGMLPNLNIKQVGSTHFIIIAEYSEHFRVYSFAKNGQLLGGENINKNPKVLKDLIKSTMLEYYLPKEKPKLTIDDITLHYKSEFEKTLKRLNRLFGFNFKVPYTIIAHKDLSLRMGRMFGCAKTKNQDKLVITPKVYKKDIFEVIIVREILFLYLRDLIVLFQDIEGEEVYWYDLAIFFANFYLRNEKNDYIKNIMEKTTISFLNFQDGNKYYFSDKVLEVLKKNTKIYTTKEINVLFSNVFGCLKVLKEYKIRFSYIEFANLFYELCDLFLEGNNNDLFKPCSKINYLIFHYDHFQKTLEMNKDSKKDAFLCLMFGLLSNKDSKVKSLSHLIQDIKVFTEDEIIQKEVVNFQKLIDDSLIEYIYNKSIKVKFSYEIENKSLELVVDIKNDSEIVFQNFTYNLTWKPKNRINQISVEEQKKSKDLHQDLRKKYVFSIEKQGTISFFLTITFTNPLNLEKSLKIITKLDKINFENKEELL